MTYANEYACKLQFKVRKETSEMKSRDLLIRLSAGSSR